MPGLGPRKFQKRESYGGRDVVLGAVQRAIVSGDTGRVRNLQELDVALEIQHQVRRRSWHESPEVVRTVGLEFWSVVRDLYDDIPEHVSIAAEAKSRRNGALRVGAFVAAVVALVGVGAAIRGGSVRAQEAAQEMVWDKQNEAWKELIQQQRLLLSDEPIYHEEEIHAGRENRDDGDN